MIGALIGAGSALIGNAAGSYMNSAIGASASRGMARYNYKLQKKGYREFPTAQVEGLRAAGINPMAAYGSIGSATFSGGNLQSGHDSNIGSSALNDYRENRKVDPAIENVKADTDLKKDQGSASTIQAEAAATNAKSQAKIADAQANLLNVQASKVATETPGETTWGTTDRILDNVGSVGTAIGGSALAAKGIHDMLKKPVVKGKAGTLSSTPAPKVIPKAAPKVRSGNSAARLGEIMKMVAPWTIPTAAAAGSLYGGKKLMDQYDKSKNAKKLKDSMHIWSHGNWSR